jgi:hypothetical protein
LAKVKVYVSSTFTDLEECRKKVHLALRQVGHEDVAMEYYVAGAERPVEKCLADVADCDLYVGLFAWRYGYVPAADNPGGLSITEMEYRRAREKDKPCLIFLLSEDAPWPRTRMDRDPARIERLRDELRANHLVGFFSSPEDIGDAVYPAVYKWSEEHGRLPQAVSIPELNLAAYVKALTRRYQHLDLDALTPPQRDENLRQRLREVFVEQSVREDPPPVELPKDILAKLQRDGEIRPEDLPAGVAPEDLLSARESYFESPPRPVLDALTDPAHRRSVVLGDPGSGKSTLARYVLLSLVGVEGDGKLRRAFEGYLPLLVELRSYAGRSSEVKESSFLDFVEYTSDSEGWGLDRAALEHHLKTDGRAVVIFDGLDEIFDPEDRKQAALRIAGFADTYPKAHIIVMSRVVGYRRKVLTDAEFSHFTLQDLDERQVEQFIDRWYALALGERPEEALARRERIMRSFKDSPSIRQLAGNPMLLTIMAIIGKNQELPRERWRLYDHAASVLIHHWEAERYLRARNLDAPFIGEPEKKEFLRRLAFRMQGGGGGLAGNYIHRDDLQHEFETYLSDRFAQSAGDAAAIARAMIDQFRERNFILSLYGANLYGFVHRAFLEFFCADAFVQRFEKRQKLTLDDLKRDAYGAHWRDRSWHEVLRLICGMIDERFAGELIDYLTREVGTPPEGLTAQGPPLNLDLAVRCLSEVNNIGSVAGPAQRLLKSICAFLDHEMAGHLQFFNFVKEKLIPSIESVGARWPAGGVLADWLRSRGDLPYSYIYDRRAGLFIGALGRADAEIHQIILDYSRREESSYRVLVPFSLAAGWRDDESTRPLLFELAADDPHQTVRFAAIFATAEYFRDDPRTLPLLHNALNDDHHWVRAAALKALGTFYGDREGTLPLLRHHAVNDPNKYPRNVAVTAIGEYFTGAPGTLALIRERAVNDPSPTAADEQNALNEIFVREKSLALLARFWPRHPDTLPLLRERAGNDPVPWMRKKAGRLADELELRSRRPAPDA